MSFTTRIAAAVLATAGVSFAAPAALAQETQGTEAQPPAPAQSQAVSQEKLEAFALAALDVQELQIEYAPTLEAATSEEERLQIADQALGEMVEAVEASPGITVDEYNAIAEAVTVDPALAAQVQDKMKEVAGE